MLKNYSEKYLQQVSLLIKLLTSIRQESCFALKGGTAINLFFREMPRLSVDIDLTFLPFYDRNTSLKMIHEAMQSISDDIKLRNKNITLAYKRSPENLIRKIIAGNERVMIEPNEVLRCHLYPVEFRKLSNTAAELLSSDSRY